MHDLAFHSSVRNEQREVTLLFADLRGFTELAASLETIPLVCDLVGHVMDCLTDAVARHHGCVVDYYCDGLLAMWNAPTDQADHPDLACRAALEMLETLPTVTAEWASAIQTDLRLGIGVHTGIAQVGNAGSTRQTKYGPRGPSVHLANRVEAATKKLRLPFVATTATAERLSGHFATNRICRARMPGFGEPVDLYAICHAPNDPRLAAAWQRYETALRHFETGRLQEAADILAAVGERSAGIPWSFLTSEIERELGREQRRRSTDEPAHHGGVIALNAK
jgi:adenylate cyclase